MSDRPHRAAERVFRALFRIYPSAFRESYEQDAFELFRDQIAEAEAAGRWAVRALCLRTLPKVFLNGVLERLSDLGAAVGRAGSSGVAYDAARRLVRSPVTSATIVLTLGLGIGANVALYGVLRGVLLRPLPYPEADRLVRLWETNPDVDGEHHGPSPLNFADWEREAEGFEAMTAWYLTSGTFRTDEWVEEIRSAQVTADFFRTLGVAPAIGRDFRPEEVTRYGPVMLSHRVWARLFGSDPSVVGQTIVASNNSYEIVGVMPPGFVFPDESVEAWIAWDLPTVYADRPETRTWRFLAGLGRLEPDRSVADAELELDRVAAGLARDYPEWDRGWDAEVTSLHEEVVGDVRATLWLAFGAVLFILLIACVNVANLLLARVPARAGEVHLRAALGATRGRIAGELFMENLVLGLAAGVVGLASGAVLIDGLVALDAGRLPRLAEVSIDPAVFAFTAAIAVATSLIFGSAPLLELVRAPASGPSSSGTRVSATPRQRRLRELFVGSQIAMALVLLTGAGLFAMSLDRLTHVDPGLDPANVASFRVSLDPMEGGERATAAYYDGLIERLRGVPGVLSVAASQTTPLNPVSNDFTRPYRPSGSGLASADAPTVQMRIVTSGYIETMGMTLLAGSGIPEDVQADGPLVAVVNQTLAARLRPGADVVGEVLDIDFREGWQPYRILGVVRDVKHYGLRADPQPEVFLAHRQIPYLAMTLVARTREEPELYYDDLRDAVLSQVPVQPAHNFVSIESLLSDSTAEERFLSVLLSLFAAVGLVLAATGVYGVIAYSVGHRRREIGVRMALGADPRRVVRSVMYDASIVTGLGIVGGIVGVATLGPLVQGLLFDVAASDPWATGAVTVLLAVVAGVASWLPARRAARFTPVESLRSE